MGADRVLETENANDRLEQMRLALMEPVSEAELNRRRSLVETVLASRGERHISPYTAADLVHAAREERSLDEK